MSHACALRPFFRALVGRPSGARRAPVRRRRPAAHRSPTTHARARRAPRARRGPRTVAARQDARRRSGRRWIAAVRRARARGLPAMRHPRSRLRARPLSSCCARSVCRARRHGSSRRAAGTSNPGPVMNSRTRHHPDRARRHGVLPRGLDRRRRTHDLRRGDAALEAARSLRAGALNGMSRSSVPDPVNGGLCRVVNEARTLCRVLVWNGSGLCISQT